MNTQEFINNFTARLQRELILIDLPEGWELSSYKNSSVEEHFLFNNNGYLYVICSIPGIRSEATLDWEENMELVTNIMKKVNSYFTWIYYYHDFFKKWSYAGNIIRNERA